MAVVKIASLYDSEHGVTLFFNYHEMKLKESNPYITKAELLEAEPTFTVILIGDDKQYGPIPPSNHIFEVLQDDELL